MSKKYEARITQVTVLPEGDAIFSELATVISIDDEAGGEFVTIGQSNHHSEAGRVAFDASEWPMVRGEIDAMVVRCRQDNSK